MSELEVKREFRSCWDGWCGSFEFGLGGDNGAPDLQVLIGTKSPRLLPIELKIGEERSSGIILPHRVRPAQVRWHTDFAEAGGRALLCVGTKGVFWFIDAKHIAKWSSGFMVGFEAWALQRPTRKDLESWLVQTKLFRKAELA